MSSIVTIDLTKHPNNVPLGMLLAPGAGGTTSQSSESFGNYLIKELRDDNTSNNLPTSSNVTLVAGWEHSNNNSSTAKHLGPVQRSGLVRLGDRLVRINNKDISDWTFREVMDALKELRDDNSSSTASTERRSRIRLKSLGFAPANTSEWLKGTNHHTTTSTSDTNFFGLFNSQHGNANNNNTESISLSHVVHSKRTYSFVSFIGRWRVAYESPSSIPVDDKGQQQRVESNNNSNTDHSLPPNRQLSENSTSELERQLFKEPSMMVNTREDTRQSSSSPPLSLLQREESKVDATTNEQSATTAATAERKPYIEYEIQCHLLFRDPNSFFTNRHNTGLNTGLNSHSNKDEHHSWSVWKRFSELQALDEELRYDFGWQMDAFAHDNKDDNRVREMGSILLSSGEREGIVFPSAHGLESWWYNVRNGGGVVNTLLGESSDIVSDSTGREKKSQVANRADRQQQESGWGSSLYSYFRTASNTSNDKRRNSTETNNSHTSNNNCPIPIPFIERRQKELASYWSDLMKIEDIFEFSDVHSHKFGKTMAAFLEVDKVLMARKDSISGAASLSSSPLQQQHHPSRFPAIHENEPELYGTSLRPSLLDPSGRLSTMTPTREVSGLTMHDDDVSLLSDGTGAFDNHHLTSHNSPIRGRPMVDVVPKQYINDNGISPSETPEKKASSSRSVASTSVASSRKNRIKAPRAKPAFQRQRQLLP